MGDVYHFHFKLWLLMRDRVRAIASGADCWPAGHDRLDISIALVGSIGAVAAKDVINHSRVEVHSLLGCVAGGPIAELRDVGGLWPVPETASTFLSWSGKAPGDERFLVVLSYGGPLHEVPEDAWLEITIVPATVQ